ncbi:diaminopimelate epimerase [Oceanobacillus sp. CAU 1775]
MYFTKMHGLGNSYILFNQLDKADNILSEHEYPRLSRKISDVNYGIGSDGIILICLSEVADFKMRIFNEDGTEAKNCGNGLRCVARYLYEYQYSEKSYFTIETLGGIVNIEVEIINQAVEFVKVDMGKPKLLKGMIPMEGNPLTTTINEAYTISENEYNLTCISMGNPHAVMFVDNIHDIQLEEIGPKIERSDLFPEGVNLSVVHVRNRKELDYRVWERGSGITMACGTGSCAAVVAATLNNLIDKNQPILVHLPGGDLSVRWDDNGHVWMQGEASYVCHGELDNNFLLNY